MLKFLESLYLEQTFESLAFRDSRQAPTYTNQDILMHLLLRCILGYFTQKDQSFCSNDPLLSRSQLFVHSQRSPVSLIGFQFQRT